MDLATTASLIIATFDLAVVRSIRDAIRTADIHSGRGQPVSGLGPAPNPEPRLHIHPQPVYEPRRHIHPTPKIEERLVCYTVRYKRCAEPLPPAPPCPEPAIPLAPATPKPAIEGPLPPVWAKLPPVPDKPRILPRRIIKTSVIRSDIQVKGLVLDVHI